MQAQQDLSELQFVNLHVVDKNYHELHSQLKYVMYRKIGESQNLLMNTELPIGTISDRMGFLDNCHFSTTFKKYIGLTPTQYRQHFQKSPYNRLISHS